MQYSWLGRTQGGLGQQHTLSWMCMCTCLGPKALPSCLWHWKLLFNLLKWISGVFLPHFCLRLPRREKKISPHVVASTYAERLKLVEAQIYCTARRGDAARVPWAWWPGCPSTSDLPHNHHGSQALLCSQSLLLLGCIWMCESQM